MKRRNFIQAGLGSVGLISTRSLSAHEEEKANRGLKLINLGNPPKPLHEKTLGDFRKFFEFTTISTCEPPRITIDIPSTDDYVLCMFYEIYTSSATKQELDKNTVIQAHNNKLISDIEGLLGATLSDVKNRDINHPYWNLAKEGKLPLNCKHWLIDMGRFDGVNHVDLRTSQVWELIINDGVKLGKVYRCKRKYAKVDGLYQVTEQVSVMGFNTHIIARPYLGDNYA